MYEYFLGNNFAIFLWRPAVLMAGLPHLCVRVLSAGNNFHTNGVPYALPSINCNVKAIIWVS